MTIIITYLVVINVIGFVVMGMDKRRAVKGDWRISETTLFGVALLGGALGCTLGMQCFRHKTKHWYFRLGMPAIFVVQVLCVVFLLQGTI